MPVWHRLTKDAVAAGKLVVVGLIQEQHPDRCVLYSQWRELGWTILHDPLNLIGAKAVPIPIAIDEHGIVRENRLRPGPEFLTSFVEQEFPNESDKKPRRLGLVDPSNAEKRARSEKTADAWRAFGDHLVLGWEIDRATDAVDAYREALAKDANAADLWFRLGVALRMRYDSDAREAGDFQAAVDAWSKALEIDPNHYIYRRRIQQYGPRLDKPYPFYDWVDTARREIAARGETPHPLVAEPVGAELAEPSRRFATSEIETANGDPGGKIHRDESGLIALEAVVVRGTPGRGQGAAQVHLNFRPDAGKKGHWNNEAEPLRVWLDDPPAGTVLSQGFVELSQPAGQATSDELRTASFEVKLPRRAPGPIRIRGYALYNCCEDASGVCQFLRRDFEVELEP